MTWDRIERLEALLKEKIAIIVLERLSDPRLGFVTITGVKLSRDKRHAKVLYTVLGTAGQRRTTDRALADAARHVQEQLAPTLHMRVMPELRFTYDESIAKESRMLDLLDELASQRPGGQVSAQNSLADSEAAARAEEKDGPEVNAEADPADKGGMTETSETDIQDAAGDGGGNTGDPRGSGDPRGADGGVRGPVR